MTHDQALAAAETKPSSDANRSQEMAAAGKQLAAAREALQKAHAAFADPALATTYPSVGPTYPSTSTGRRRALALWITSRDNPLAARVAVNHIWLRHFHSPLVSSVFDFGRNGARPTHPELLDWLAVEFMESGWSMKHIHRLLYDQPGLPASFFDRRRRPNTRAIRKTICCLADERRPHGSRGGTRQRALCGRKARLCDGWPGTREQRGADHLSAARCITVANPKSTARILLGALFDAPEPADCYRRTRSVVPQQALALTNSDLVHEMSGHLAELLQRQLPPEQQADRQIFIMAAFEQILARAPSAAESRACAAFLEAPANGSNGQDAARRREGLVRALLNHNDFVSIR